MYMQMSVYPLLLCSHLAEVDLVVILVAVLAPRPADPVGEAVLPLPVVHAQVTSYAANTCMKHSVLVSSACSGATVA